jgi:hypothetical protein
VFAIKGSEPAAFDFPRLLQNLRRPSPSTHTIVEHLVWEEFKAPGAIALDEASREARLAAEAQSRHLRAYGDFARLPLPLLVLRHHPRTEAEYLARIRRELGDAGFARLRERCAGGLGVYVYHYPVPPVRACEAAALLARRDFRARLLTLLTFADPDVLLGRWVALFARLLYLGIIPGSLAASRTGLCCQPQNACMDGGFVDLDSLAHPASLRDDGELYGALALSFKALVDTAEVLVLDNVDGDSGVERQLIAEHLSHRLREALVTERRPGLFLHPRIAAFFQSVETFAGLTDMLAKRRAAGDPGFWPAGLGDAAAARLREACVDLRLGEQVATFPSGVEGAREAGE